MLSNKKLNPMVTELFIRGRKLNISLGFIMQCYLAAPKNLLWKFESFNKSFNHLSDIDFEDKKCTKKPCSFLVIDAAPASNDPSP